MSNRATSVRDGLKLFEVTDVMLLDNESDVGARNERRLGVLYTGPTAGFEVVHGIVDKVMALLEIAPRPHAWEKVDGASGVSVFGKRGARYYVEPTNDVSSFFPGRGARVLVEREGEAPVEVGTVGVLHPKVLTNFELVFPVSVAELNLQALMNLTDTQ